MNDIAQSAVIAASARIGKNVQIMDCAVVREGVEIEDNVVIGPHSVIGEYLASYYDNPSGYKPPVTRIGRGSLLRSHAVIYGGVRLGENFRSGHSIVIREFSTFGRNCLFGSYCQTDEKVAVGWNSRLDELQAAILRVKLRHLDEWNEKRAIIAGWYRDHIRHPAVEPPPELQGRTSAHHLYVVRCDARDELRSWLESGGIGCMVHYPKPVHLQSAFAHLGIGEGALPRSERHCRRILSLPVFPELEQSEVLTVCARINAFSQT